VEAWTFLLNPVADRSDDDRAMYSDVAWFLAIGTVLAPLAITLLVLPMTLCGCVRFTNSGIAAKATFLYFDLVYRAFFLSITIAIMSPWPSCSHKLLTHTAYADRRCFDAQGPWLPMAIFSGLLFPFYLRLVINFGCIFQSGANMMQQQHPGYKGFAFKSDYLVLDYMLRSLVAGAVAFLGEVQDWKRYIYLGVLLVANLALVLANRLWKPCSLDSLNVCQFYTLIASLWSCLVSIFLSLSFDGHIDLIEALDESQLFFWLWLVGVLGIGTAAAAHALKRSRTFKASLRSLDAGYVEVM
jgi:hypothetical protein